MKQDKNVPTYSIEDAYKIIEQLRLMNTEVPIKLANEMEIGMDQQIK